MTADVDSSIRKLLLADQTIADLVVDRVRPIELHQLDAVPAIVYQRLSRQTDLDFDGPGPVESGVYQIGIFVSRYEKGTLDLLADRLRAILHGFKGEVATGDAPNEIVTEFLLIEHLDETEQNDSDVQQWALLIDFEFTYRT